MTLRICGVDPSLNHTGYGVIRVTEPGRNASVIEAGVIRTSADGTLADRLVELADAMEDVLAEHRPDLIGVEELYSHYRHPRTAILMGHARGVLMLAAARAGVNVVSFPPTRVKYALTGNGRAGKVQMQRAIMVTLGLPRPPEPSDVADALAVAWCAGAEAMNALRSGRRRGTHRTRLEIKGSRS